MIFKNLQSLGARNTRHQDIGNSPQGRAYASDHTYTKKHQRRPVVRHGMFQASASKGRKRSAASACCVRLSYVYSPQNVSVTRSGTVFWKRRQSLLKREWSLL